jgi:hypothetical protein
VEDAGLGATRCFATSSSAFQSNIAHLSLGLRINRYNGQAAIRGFATVASRSCLLISCVRSGSA